MYRNKAEQRTKSAEQKLKLYTEEKKRTKKHDCEWNDFTPNVQMSVIIEMWFQK